MWKPVTSILLPAWNSRWAAFARSATGTHWLLLLRLASLYQGTKTWRGWHLQRWHATVTAVRKLTMQKMPSTFSLFGGKKSPKKRHNDPCWHFTMMMVRCFCPEIHLISGYMAPGQIWPREQFQRLGPKLVTQKVFFNFYVEHVHVCISNLRCRVLKPRPRCAMLAMSGAWFIWSFARNFGLWVAETIKKHKKNRLKDCCGSKLRWKPQVCWVPQFYTSAIQPTEVQPHHCLYPGSTRGRMSILMVLLWDCLE